MQDTLDTHTHTRTLTYIHVIFKWWIEFIPRSWLGREKTVFVQVEWLRVLPLRVFLSDNLMKPGDNLREMYVKQISF